jgi:hypothetical protein
LQSITHRDSLVDASTKVFDIVFSQQWIQAVIPSSRPKRKRYIPVVGVVGFSEDRKTFSVKVELQPNHDYEFIITTWDLNLPKDFL